MKQVIRKGLKEIVVDEVPDPVAAPHHVLVRPHYSLISSGTETASIHTESLAKEVADNPSHVRKVLDVMRQAGPLRTLSEVRAKFSEYAVLGYSGAGVVVEKHETVRDLEVGARVAYGGEGTGHGETILAGRNLVARVPGAVPFEHACFATLGSIAMNAVRIAEIALGETVVVVGLGLVGQLVAQLARLQGGVVVATDLRRDRVALALALGAEHATENARDAVASATDGRGADVVVVAAAAKSDAPCRLALELCRDRGRIVVVGAVEMSFPWQEMYMKEVRLLMSRAYGPGSYDEDYERRGRDYPLPYVRWTENRNMEEFLRLAAAGRLQLEPLITHRFPLADAARAYETIMNPSASSLAVLLRYPATDAASRDGEAASDSGDAASGDGGGASGEGGAVAASFVPRRRVEVASSSAASRRASNELRVALVGAGNIVRWAHMPALKKFPGARLEAVFSASGARGKSYARRFGATYCASDYAEVLRDENVDAVLIATRNQHHAAQSLAALEAGKHVFVEKPMALTVEECRALTRAVAASGKQLAVGFNRRFAPFYRELKKELARRAGPAVLNCRVNSPGISGSYWMADPAIGGAILGEAVHFVDLLYWLLDSEPVSVFAQSLPTGKEHPVGENNVAASFRFADGSVASLTYCTVGSKTSAGERVEAFAEGLGVSTEDFKRLDVRKGTARTRSRWWGDKGYDEQLASFLTALSEGRKPEVTVADGARATLGCLAIMDSARTGEPREIDLETMKYEGGTMN